MPKLTPSQGRRLPMVPPRRVERARNPLAWAGGISIALHLLVIAALIVQFPDQPPREAPPTPSVNVVFEGGQKKASAAAEKKGVSQVARQAAPRGPKAPEAPRVAQAPPPPLPPPPPPVPVQKPVPVPQPKPVPKPAPPPPKPAPPRPKPPAPPLPAVKLPPTPPAPKVPPPPTPSEVPMPTPPPTPDEDMSQAQMNVPMPTLPPFSLPMPAPPLPTPPSPPVRTTQRRTSRSRSTALGGALMMNGLSFNGGGSPSGGTGKGLNTALAETDKLGGDAASVIKGDVGADWLSVLDQWVQDHTYYPEFAAESGQQGDVTVQFTVERDGTVSQYALIDSSHYPLLNQAFLSVFRNAKVPRLPSYMKSNQAVIQFRMEYVLVH